MRLPVRDPGRTVAGPRRGNHALGGRLCKPPEGLARRRDSEEGSADPMKVLERGVDPGAFFRAVAEAPERALILDYDGTLAPFREARDRAYPYPGVREALAGLRDAGHSRLVVVSGRWTADLVPLLGLDPPPEIWGSHGWERLRGDGSLELGQMDEEALRGLAEADRWVEERGVEGRAEQKPGCLALHLRGLSPAAGEALKRRARKALLPLARRTGLELHEFDGGLELRVPGRDKGDAVRAVLAELHEAAAVAYLGDDRTDEDAFAALDGRGLRVLVRPERRPTAADLWLRPPEELLAFLSRWDREAGEGAGPRREEGGEETG